MATIEIDGKTLDVDNGKMIIEAADDAGIYIPRFCYHKKLSVAANCRMCLVEVENNRKTVPACATPISHGMKVFTKSPAAIQSQQAVMEFLLINHPLDCPVCDQGGECDLQDLSMGFGSDSGDYGLSKRAVANDDLGALISTEMTRCIQCTRCVRFGDEVAGVPELGGLGRGENMQIGTYVQHSMSSEVSANIIDLCPVGALTSKPFKFKARSWEMMQHASVAPHDCLGSNVYVHTRREEVMRVVPKELESINETWLSDRDRFSYLGLNSPHRAHAPMIKRNGEWEVVDWQTALSFAVTGMQRVLTEHGADQWAALASPSSTLEECYLLQQLMRTLGVNNLDHRLHQTDFSDDCNLQLTSTLPYAELSEQATIFLVGCNVAREVPLAVVRIRKAFKNGGNIYAINAVDYDFPFAICDSFIVSPDEWPRQLAMILSALVPDNQELPESVLALLVGLTPDEKTCRVAQALRTPSAVLVTGELCDNHPYAATLRTLIALIAEYSGAKVLRFTTGANTAGASLAGMLPNFSTAGIAAESPGLNVQAALAAKLKGYLLMGAEPIDIANSAAASQALLGAEFVVALSAFQNTTIKAYANVILPIAPYAETSGTYINLDGTWQTVKGALACQAQSRPAWKVLRVLANKLICGGFEYNSTAEVLDDIKQQMGRVHTNIPERYFPESLPFLPQRLVRVGEWPLYRCDAIVRHAAALQDAASADYAKACINPITADIFKLGDTVTVSQGDIEITLPLKHDMRIAQDVVWVQNAFIETMDLGHAFATISIKSCSLNGL